MCSWKTFEYIHGTSEQIHDCHEICERIIENYNRHMVIASKAPKGQKRKNEAESDSKIVEKKQKVVAVEENKATKPKQPVQKEPQSTKPELKPHPEQPQHEYGGKDDVSVFLSNLAYDVTKEQIKAALPELKVVDVTLVLEPSGRNKGFGYVELSNPSEVEKALTFDRRPIQGRPVFISKIVRERGIRPSFKYSESLESNKIFIKGLPFNTSKDELQILFGKFGTIKDIRLVTKK